MKHVQILNSNGASSTYIAVILMNPGKVFWVNRVFTKDPVGEISRHDIPADIETLVVTIDLPIQMCGDLITAEYLMINPQSKPHREMKRPKLCFLLKSGGIYIEGPKHNGSWTFIHIPTELI